MPLSEHEQRLLDDIEKALYADDPKFAASVRTARRRRPGRRWIPVAVLGVLVGLGLVLLGLLIANPIPGVAGFVVVVAAIVYGAYAVRGGTSTGSPDDASSITGPGKRGGPGGSSKAPADGIRARMEDRMRRRFEADGNS